MECRILSLLKRNLKSGKILNIKGREVVKMLRIGIDLGGTNIVASVVNDEYKILATGKTPTNVPRAADEIFDDIAAVCQWKKPE